MDSITQAVLGGAVGYAVLGRKLGKRAALIGAGFGTLPDLDVLIDFGGPIENMTYHRGVSHSIFVQALVTPLIAWLMLRFKAHQPASFLRWCWALYLIFVTHSLADTFTVYGTQILWPVTDFPFSHSILFIVDPTYTVPLIVAFVGALILKPDRAIHVTAVALVFSTGYLVWSSAAKRSIDAKVAAALTERGIAPEVYESTPAPLNTLLWRGVAVQGDQYYEIWASVFDEVQDVQIYAYPRNQGLLDTVRDHPSIERLRWFTKGQYKAWQTENRVYISDLRMGVEGAYVFNFEAATLDQNGVSLGSFQQLEQRPDFGSLGTLWARIFDPQISLSVEARQAPN